MPALYTHIIALRGKINKTVNKKHFLFLCAYISHITSVIMTATYEKVL